MAKPLSDAAINLLKGVSTATLTTQLFRRGFRNVFMQGVAPLGKIGNDNLVGPPGHVLVQDCRGDRTAASCGSILATRLKVRGAAGMVSDGPVRDSGVIAELGFPVFCAGASAPTNIIKHHSIDLNVPIGCGGVAVYPNDIVVGDIDGVVVVPLHLAEEIAVDAAEQEKMEDFIKRRVEEGAPLRGTYPPNDETKSAYLAWKAQNNHQEIKP